MKDLPPAGGGAQRLLLLTASTYARLREILSAPPLTPDSKQFEVSTRGQTRTFRLRLAEVFRQIGGIAEHPWKATAKGDDKVQIAPGTIMYALATGSPGDDMAPIRYEPLHYDGGEVTITDAGTIYAKLEVIVSAFNGIVSSTEIPGSSDTLVLQVRPSDNLLVIFQAGAFSQTGSDIYYPIANVDFEDGIATVSRQILTHNPTHDLVWSSTSTGS